MNQLDGFSQSDSLSKQIRLNIGVLNDNWGLGSTKVYDDYRTYGIQLKFEKANKYTLALNYSALTFKNLDQSSFASRADELIFTFQAPILKRSIKSVSILPAFGFISAGNWGGSSVQNTTHQLFGVQKDTLSYEFKNRLLYHFRLKVQSKPIVIKKLSNQYFFLQPYLETFFAPNYFSSEQFAIPLNLSSDNQNIISFNLCYKWINNLSNINVVNKTLEKEKGIYIENKISMGLFSFNYVTYPGNGFSTGMYGINLFNKSQKKTYTKSDFEFEFGALNNSDGFYNKLALNKSNFLPNRFKFIFYNQYATFLRKKLPNYPSHMGNTQVLSLGGQINMFENKTGWQANPYLGFNSGIKTNRIYAGTALLESEKIVVPIVLLESGLKIKLPQKLSYKNTLWEFVICYKYLKPLNSNLKAFNNEHHIKEKFNYVSAGLNVCMDL